jgi:endoglucanase
MGPQNNAGPSWAKVNLLRTRLLLVCAALLVVASVGSAGVIRSLNAAATTSTLTVVGNHLVDNGKTVVLRGVNRSGSEYACWQGYGFFDGPSDDASAAAIAAWGSNAVRVPFNEDCWLGINGINPTYAGANYQAAISGFVTRLRAHGLYVILSNQVAGPGTTKSTTILPMPDADHAPAAWSSVASKFAPDKGVIFDLYNEPHDVSWSCWANGCQVTGGVNFVTPYQAAGMNGLTAAIRAAGATNVILIPGLSWSYDLSGWLANRPADSQLIAGIHNYGVSGWNTPAIWNNIYAPTSLQVPVTFGEMGFDGYVEQIMPWADAHGIGYLAWTWDTWGDQQSLISNYNGTATTYGLNFKNYLASVVTQPPPVSPSPTPTAAPSPTPSPTSTPSSTPSPPPPPPSGTVYDFETGLAGWQTAWGGATIAGSTTRAFTGTHSVAITVPAVKDWPAVDNQTGPFPGLASGNVASFQIWSPAANPLTIVPFVYDGSWSPHFTAAVSLNPGWNLISFVVPTVSAFHGIGFQMTNLNAWGGTLYLDTVGWTGAPTPTPTPTPTPSPSPSPTPISINGVPCTVTINGVQMSGTCTGTFQG